MNSLEKRRLKEGAIIALLLNKEVRQEREDRIGKAGRISGKDTDVGGKTRREAVTGRQ